MISSRNVLICHPDTPCRHVRAISARVQRTSDGAIALVYTLDGDLDRLRIPPPGPPRRADRLWEHTCFEAFVTSTESHGYCELNFAPSGEWAAYAFWRYRNGGALELGGHPAISARRMTDRFEFEAMIHLDRLPGMLRNAPLRLGLSAVVEDHDGARSYWALRHPPGKPDFHHREAFALALDPAVEDLTPHPAAEAKQ